MPPHPPPCLPDERLWGSLCYPKIDAIRIMRSGDNFDFVLGDVPSELLPELAKSAGGQGHLVVKKADPGFEVTIKALPRGEANELLKQLKPDSGVELPE
ncbi:hypothetical protein LPB73_13755 [Tardiphaga sp. 37S4]|uniref:hypothetical protein n=1 Tax=Tardiphaga sp. 37S4 TaxID=1404741 RepID=UPI001E5C833E|nr:hypothetical protein [Tardiphaga sp. 37S4]UFS78372.1 hypothetical protein LPB73_13755 [Tardiphaga sp. 37S4]